MMDTMLKDTADNTLHTGSLSMSIRANDPQVLSDLYQNHYYKVERYVSENNGSVAEAKDIYQEAFIAVWQKILQQKFSPDTESAFAAYLFNVSKYKWIDVLRLQKRVGANARFAIDPQHDNTNDLPDAQEAYTTLVRKHFVKLGKTCQEVLTQFYFYGQSLQTIAAVHQWTEATTKNNKYRCIQQLRALVKKEKK